ncbi:MULTISPECIES: GGDEF domain-containing protein [Halomonadaceae]|uniref:GGDEF domain-containing protein n=1 Tax=Halomonadaceae TaxID=28256 RepID=UPI00336BB54C
MSEQKRLERELEQQATHDRLTGLYNRGFFDQVLDKEIGRAARYGHPLSLILMDIDHFKAINDTYGHLVGDEILKGLAASMARRLREPDTPAWWGGEEFIALLPATQATEARELAEGIRKQVADEAFPDVGHITISLGMAELEPGESLKDLTRRGDDALYAANSAGRDQVRMA